MEILKMNSQTQEVVKISNSQFYTGNVRSVKQRAKQFNSISNNNNDYSVGNKNSAFVNTQNNINKNNNEVKKNGSVPNGNHSVKSVATSTITTANSDNNNNNKTSVNNIKNSNQNGNNNNIKISIVNKYTATNNNSISASNNNDNHGVERSDVKTKINHINTTCITSPSKLSILWNSSGWIRVYCGPDRSELTSEDPSRMVHVAANSTTVEVVKDMDLPVDYTLWVSFLYLKLLGEQTSKTFDPSSSKSVVKSREDSSKTNTP
jgi:hypothetical protein